MVLALVVVDTVVRDGKKLETGVIPRLGFDSGCIADGASGVINGGCWGFRSLRTI